MLLLVAERTIRKSAQLSYLALCGGLSGTFQCLDHTCIFSLFENTGQIDIGRCPKSPRKGYLTGRRVGFMRCIRIRYGQRTRFFDCRNSNITLWRRDQRTIRRNHLQQIAKLSGSQKRYIGGRVRRLLRRFIFALLQSFSGEFKNFPVRVL